MGSRVRPDMLGPFGFTAREVRARCEVLFESLWPWGGRRGRDLWPLLCLERIPGQGCVTRPVLYSTGILVQPWTVKQEPQQNISVMDWSIFRVVLKTGIDRVLALEGLFSRVLGSHWYVWLGSLYKWLHSHPSVFGRVRRGSTHYSSFTLWFTCSDFQDKYLRSLNKMFLLEKVNQFIEILRKSSSKWDQNDVVWGLGMKDDAILVVNSNRGPKMLLSACSWNSEDKQSILFYIYSVIFSVRFGCMKSLLASQRVCLSFGNPLKPGGTNSLFLFVSLTQRAVLCSESCCVCTSVALNATMVLSSKKPPSHYQLFYSRQQS